MRRRLRFISKPCILYWDKRHFVVLYKISKRKNGYRYHIADPGGCKLKITRTDLEKVWLSNNIGYVMLVEPTENINIQKLAKPVNKVKYLLSKFKVYKSHWISMLLSILIILFIQVITPFFTQSIIDNGIKFKNIDYVKLLIIAQVAFVCMKSGIEFLRNIVLLKMSTNISLDIISEYITKVIKLPVSFFNTKVLGDFIQRISDGQTIEHFLTHKALDLMYSALTIIIFYLLCIIITLSWL